MSCIRDDVHSKLVRRKCPTRAIGFIGIFLPQDFLGDADGLSRTLHVKPLESRALTLDQVLASATLKRENWKSSSTDNKARSCHTLHYCTLCAL